MFSESTVLYTHGRATRRFGISAFDELFMAGDTNLTASELNASEVQNPSDPKQRAVDAKHRSTLHAQASNNLPTMNIRNMRSVLSQIR